MCDQLREVLRTFIASLCSPRAWARQHFRRASVYHLSSKGEIIHDEQDDHMPVIDKGEAREAADSTRRSFPTVIGVGAWGRLRLSRRRAGR